MSFWHKLANIPKQLMELALLLFLSVLSPSLLAQPSASGSNVQIQSNQASGEWITKLVASSFAPASKSQSLTSPYFLYCETCTTQLVGLLFKLFGKNLVTWFSKERILIRRVSSSGLNHVREELA
jgi:hypothetical protein